MLAPDEKVGIALLVVVVVSVGICLAKFAGWL